MAQPGLMTKSLHHRGFCACAKSLPELLDSKGCRILGYLGKHKRKPKRLKIKTSLFGRLPHLLTFIEYESFWHATSHRKELNAQTELPQFVHVAASAPYHFQNQKVYYTDKKTYYFLWNWSNVVVHKHSLRRKIWELGRIWWYGKVFAIQLVKTNG